MTSSSKGDKKAVLDVGAWLFNIVTSVGIIIVNKALMARYGFTFGESSISFGIHLATILSSCFFMILDQFIYSFYIVAC